MIILYLLVLGLTEFKVATITITGNEYFNESAVKQVMLTKTPGFFRKGTFQAEIFNGDITAVQSLYNHNGFLEAHVAYELIFDSTDKEVEIAIDITEGKQTFVHEIQFVGNRLFTSDFLKEKITTQLNEPFDKRKLELDGYTITSLYDDRGYADAQLQSDYTITDNDLKVVHTIVEGEKQFIKEVEVNGLERTREDVARREITLKPNDAFRYADLLKSQRNLYNLGVFRSIRINATNSSQANFKIVQFSTAEKEPITINFRIGYGTQDYLRAGFGITHINMLGRAWRGKIEGKVSFAEYRLNSQLTFPRFFVSAVKYSIGAFYQFKKEISFKTRGIGGYWTTYLNLIGGKLSSTYDIEAVRTYFVDVDTTEDDLLQGITFNWLRDKRDDPLFPKRGNYIYINSETRGVVLPSDVNYVRPTFEYRVFRPMMTLVGALSVKVGIVQEVSPTTEVPVYKRFYCGGTSSVRGYSEWSIGPRDENDNPIGGRALFELSGEIRYPIYKILGGSFFIDAGNIWQEYDEIDASLRWGIGSGLRLKTPLGSVRLDYGIKIDRQPDESFGALHFAIGEAF